ncbi:MAG: response regulator [Candidatus Oleimicrobiaceae bacterium]
MNGTSILLVDDEAIVRDSLSAWLEDEGFVVHTADSGERALELFSQVKLDIAVIDIKMPGMDGLTLLKRLRELDDRVPVVMMTAHATVESAVRSMRDGAYDYLMKPFPPEKLTNLIRHVVSHQRLAMEYDRLHADWRQVRPWLAYSRQLLNLGQAFEAFVSHCGRDIRKVVELTERAQQRMAGAPLEPEQRRLLADELAAAQSQARTSLRAIESALQCATEGRPQPEAVHVGEAVERAWAITRHVPTLGVQELELAVPEDLPPVRAELWSLVQLIQNLIDFAGSALAAEGRVALRAAIVGECVEISVSFPCEEVLPEVIAALERPLFLGQCPTPPILSLVVAKLIAERYGGRLEVRSGPQGQVSLVAVMNRA